MQSSLRPRVPTMTIESDASNMGWGARQGELQTGGRWSQEETSHHINYLELLAAAVLCQAEHLPGKDNTTADRESRSTKDRCDWM